MRTPDKAKIGRSAAVPPKPAGFLHKQPPGEVVLGTENGNSYTKKVPTSREINYSQIGVKALTLHCFFVDLLLGETQT